MSLAILYSRALSGIEAPLVTVETHISNGLPRMSIVGLPEAAVKESKDRVRSAIIQAGFEFPSRIITVNLAPADLPKEGGRYDLAVALGVLIAMRYLQIDDLSDYEFAGELALSGQMRPVKGILPMAIKAKEAGRKLFVCQENADEAALCRGLEILVANHLLEVCAHLTGTDPIVPYQPTTELPATIDEPDFSEVKGQLSAKRVLEIAASGGHSILMQGPPGTGKSMLASRLPYILPLMSEAEALEVAAIRSLSNITWPVSEFRKRPFRCPHHTASAPALVGGGSSPKPGEISLAHRGVLFLDELPEFNRHVLEVLREPLEAGLISISRARTQVEYPARFQLIAAMNPCPCGYYGDPHTECRCSDQQIQRYQSRLSGPLLERIDLFLTVARIPQIELLTGRDETPSDNNRTIAKRVLLTRERQLQRTGVINSALPVKELEQVCALGRDDELFLLECLEKLKLSGRAYHRLLKVARTIADMQASERIQRHHLTEALQYRQFSLKR